MAKKKSGSPEKVEIVIPASVEKSEVVEVSPVENDDVEIVQDSDADLAKHPKFAKFKSHGGN